MRKMVILAVKFILSAGLLYLSLSKADFPALLARLDGHSLIWLSLSVAALFGQLLLGALRWHDVSSYAGAPLTQQSAIRFTVIGAFFNQTLPSSIGGDAVRLLLVRQAGAGWRAAAYSVFVDRAVGMIALAVVIAVGLPWSFRLVTDPHGQTTLALIDAAALAACFGFLAFGWITWSKLRNWRPTHHLQACSRIANRVLLGWPVGARVATMSVLVHVLMVAAAWGAAKSISAPVDFLSLLLLVPPVLLITMLPISVAGWGVRETAMMVAFGYAGLPQASGINISLLFGAATFFVGVFGGVVWLFSSEKRTALQARAT